MEELLRRYIKGEVTDAERLKIAAWLEEDPANMREFMTLRKLYDISLWQSEQVVEPARKKYFIPLRQAIFEIAKIVAIFVVGFFVAKQFLVDKETDVIKKQTIHVPSGQRAELMLADGTEVWLNSGTTLTFPERFEKNSREVSLDGEAYFSVKHDAERPFTVNTSNYAVHVLGTEFNVKAYNNSALFETSLINGSVEISSSQKKGKFRLNPDEQLVSRNGEVRVSHISDYNYFKWKEGLLCFENESIKELMDKLELYYDIKIDVRRPSLLKYNYTGKFRIKDGVEHVLKVLQLKHSFSYVIDNESNKIIIK
ncbi:MAG: FecR domain-containing protein [Parabacteroides sp.]|nr:FecR domain-containing protein [Parabacteroides sp.]